MRKMNPLYAELISKEFVDVVEFDEEFPPDYSILYIRNKSNQDTKIDITPYLGEQVPLENQNPSMEFKDGFLSFCLSAEVL